MFRKDSDFDAFERVMNPRPTFRKSFRRMILASIMGAGGCTMSAMTRHYGSLSRTGTA